MLHLLNKDVIEDTLKAHIAKFLDTNEVDDGPSKRLLTLTTFVLSNATFVRRKRVTAVQQKE